MSERVADPQAICPFVAFDDDRDFRSPVPDHRHRCFAESPAAPRALAHQAAYCLSGAFPGCPTFVDWARREAAPPKPDSQIRSLRGPAAARPPAGAGGSPASAAAISAGAESGGAPDASPRPVATPPRPVDPAPPLSEPAPRSSATDWAAPPPWAGSPDGSAPGAAGGAAAAAGAGAAAGGWPADGSEPDSASPSSAAWAGEANAGDDRAVGDAASPGPIDDTPAFLAGRSSRAAPPPPPPTRQDDGPWDDDARPDDPYAEPAPRRSVVEPRRVPVGYAPVAASKNDRRAGTSHSRRNDPAAPSWEEPRHAEVYPSLKSRGAGGGLPRPAAYALVVLVVGIGLFAAPFFLRGFGGGGEQASPTPSASSSALPSAEPSATPVPSPEQVVYIVKKGDVLSKIAAAHGVTVEQILQANPTIKNQNRIGEGDQIIIPQPLPSEIVNEEITPAP